MADPEKTNYNSLLDQDFERPTNSGLKVGNKSRFISSKEIVSDADVQKAAQQSILNTKKLAEQVKLASDNYIKLVSKKTTSENKTTDQKELENRVINELITLAVKINEDPSQPLAAGAIGLNSLLLRVILHQRDVNNDLAYNCFKMKQLLDQLISDEK